MAHSCIIILTPPQLNRIGWLRMSNNEGVGANRRQLECSSRRNLFIVASSGPLHRFLRDRPSWRRRTTRRDNAQTRVYKTVVEQKPRRQVRPGQASVQPRHHVKTEPLTIPQPGTTRPSFGIDSRRSRSSARRWKNSTDGIVPYPPCRLRLRRRQQSFIGTLLDLHAAAGPTCVTFEGIPYL